MKKVKVLHTIRQGLIGGGETHVLDLVKHLDQEKFDSYVLSFTDGPMIERLNEMGIPNQVIYTTKPFDFRVWKPIEKLIRQEKFDIIHAHGTRAASNLLKPAQKTDVPIVYTVHGWSFHDDQSPLVKKLRIQSEKYISNRTDLNISVSQSNQDTGRRYFGSYQSTVINNGINLEKFNPNGNLKNLRADWGIPENKVLIGCVVRMTKQKDPFTMIKAFETALKSEQDLHLIFVGDGELKEEAVQLTKELDIENAVTFEAFRTDVPNVLHTLDIYCLPSLWEGLPIGLLEAMGMKKAVIATNVDGSREIIQNGANGLIIEPENVDALAEAILSLARDQKLRTNLAEAAASTVQERYNVTEMTKAIENTYYHLLRA